MSEPQQVLVAGPAWVGDMVMAQSLFMTLRARGPATAVDVLAPPWSLPLLARMPEVRRAVSLPIAHGELKLRERWRIARTLRATGYDQAIVLPRSLKAALVPWLAGIPRRTGFRGELRYGLINDMRELDKGLLTQTVQRFVALGLEPGAPLPPPVPTPRLMVDAHNQQRLLNTLELNTEQPVVAFMPGAEYGPAKRWPAAYYGALASRLTEQGFQVWLFGSERDAAVAEDVQRNSGGAIRNLCGRTRLEDAIDLIALARAAVSNDSGLMHVAAAVGIPLVALYGSSTPAYTPPLSDRAEVVYLNMDCSPCFERECPHGHTRCLFDITPERVWTALAARMGL